MNPGPRFVFLVPARLIAIAACCAMVSCSGTIGRLREDSRRAAAERVAKWRGHRALPPAAEAPSDANAAAQTAPAPASRDAEMPQQPDQPAAASSEDFKEFVKALRRAVKARDAVALAAMMTPDFGYNLTPVMSGPGVFEFWDKNNLWGELEKVVRTEFRSFKGYMVAPPKFADPTQPYAGYRAGIRKTPDGWRFAYFVTGI